MNFRRLKKRWLESRDRKSTPLVELAHRNHILTSYVADMQVVEISDAVLRKVLLAMGVDSEEIDRV
ncbi:MAG: hypothetical protein LBC43_02155 [Bifidobacteriaceae bacterium]|nr:hypothetical protein [Bifidobacteriaceae bacterium]